MVIDPSFAISGGGTLILACVTVWSTRKHIKKAREIREEEKESDSKRRRLDEVQQWATKVLEFKNVYAGPESPDFAVQESARAALIAKKYIKLEAKRLDDDLSNLPKRDRGKLEDAVGRLLNILEVEQDLNSNYALKIEVQEKCVAIQSDISDLRVYLKL